MLKEKIKDDLKESMLAKDEKRTSTIRLLLSAIQYYEIQKGGAGYEADDEDVLEVIGREIKKRRESIEMYEKGGRKDAAISEQKELELLQSYLPQQMGDDEIKTIIDQAVSETGASSISDMGKVMGLVMPKVKGRSDASLVSRIVRDKLSG